MYSFEIYGSILDQLFDGVYISDRERRLTYWNSAAERITGYSRREVVGLHCWNNILQHVDEAGNSMCMGVCPLSLTLQDGEPRELEAYLHHRHGHRIPVLIRVIPLRGAGGELVGAAEVFTDNLQSRAASEKISELERLAYIDPVAGIANRRFLDISIELSLNELERYGWPFGLILMDIDGFKEVNDTYGHCVGDEILKMVATTLSKSSRPSDIIGRWGGDEFVAIVKKVDAAQAEKVAQKYEFLVSTSSLAHEAGPIQVTLSAGAVSATNRDVPTSLLAKADEKMYQNKITKRFKAHSL